MSHKSSHIIIDQQSQQQMQTTMPPDAAKAIRKIVKQLDRLIDSMVGHPAEPHDHAE